MEQIMTVQNITFVICALIALAGAFGVVMSRNPVHAALSLVATLFGVAVLFLNLNAQFLGVVQVIVYTGAIVVMIVFVIMLLGVDRDDDLTIEPVMAQRPVAYLLGLLLLSGLLLVIFVGMNNRTLVTAPTSQARAIVTSPPAPSSSGSSSATSVDPTQEADQPNVNQLGQVLFTKYVFAFELTAVLLTIAVVGAVLLARRPKHYQPLPQPEPIDAQAAAELRGEVTS